MFRKRNPEIGAPPGTLVFQAAHQPARVQVMKFTADRLEETPMAGVEEINELIDADEMVWIDVAGLDDPETLRAGGKRFGLSDLTMENIVNVPQRPKTEILDGKILSIAHVLKMDEAEELQLDQLSLVLGTNYVITIHQQSDDFLDPIRRRMRRTGSNIRQRGPDYLAYAILDSVVDGYYPLLENLGEKLKLLEDSVLENPCPTTLRQIHRLRTQLIQIRRSTWPLRDTLETLSDETDLVTVETATFLKDVYGHCAQIVDVTEMYRESAGALISTYMSSIAHRSNEIMKVLTIISSVFGPLTFIAGIYGMNFAHMPELSYFWAYPIALVVMALTGATMLIFFWKRGWLRRMELATVPAQEPASNRETAKSNLQTPKPVGRNIRVPVRSAA